MKPISLLAAQLLANKLTSNGLASSQIAALAAAVNVNLPPLDGKQVMLSSASQELGDKNLEFAYPRVCIYSSQLKNTQFEKFRSFSGEVSLVAEIWASGDLISQVDQWIHFYVEGIGEVLQANIGDWGSGVFFGGAYEVQFQAPKAGGLGFVGSAKLTLTLNASVG